MKFVTLSKYLAVYSLLLIVMSFVAFAFIAAPDSMTDMVFREHGIFEMLTFLGYMLALGLLFFYGGTHSLKTHWYLYALIMALALRELDFDKKFTTFGILKSKFFKSDIVPLTEKLIALPILLFFIVAILLWAKNHAAPYARQVFALYKPAWILGFGFGLIILSKTIDGIGRKLLDFSISLPQSTLEVIGRAEELYELAIPLAFAFAVKAYWRKN